MRNNTKLTLASAISLAMLTACGGGGGGGTSAPANNSPSATVKASGATLATSTQQDLVTNFGDDITLDASSSTDPDKDSISFEWKILAKPEASQLALNASNSKTAILKYKVDALGEYKLALTVTDSKGAKTEKIVSILANNTAPSLTTVENITLQPNVTQKETKDISVGSTILFNASQSTDADGNKISFAWALTSKPASSSSALQVNNKKASLSVDALGVYKVKVTGTDSKGASSEVIYTYIVNNRAPTTIVLGDARPVTNDTGEKSLQASVGYNILLDGSGSKDADKDTLVYTWTLLGKPAKSAVSLTDNTQSKLSVTPDVEGTYKVQLKVTDPAGASSTSTTVITVNNTRPTASIDSNVAPVASPTGPAVTIPLNTPLTVYGSNSTDPNGDALSYAWSIVSLPKGSKLAISNPNAANLTFTGDVSGSYVLRLKVTDTQNASSTQDITINIGNNAPVALLDISTLKTDIGSQVSISASNSYDEDGDKLTYKWNFDSIPESSRAVINDSSSSDLDFTPDVAGIYGLSLTVSDGNNTNTTLLTIEALKDFSIITPLNFKPDLSVYSKGLDKLLTIDNSKHQLKIIDPFKKIIKTVNLPNQALSLQISPNGKLASVLFTGQIYLIDIPTAKTIQMRSTNGPFTEAYITNDSIAYAAGQNASPSINKIDLTSGKMTGFGWINSGAQKGVYADKLSKVFFVQTNSSPGDIYYFTINNKTKDVTGFGDSPYHGEINIHSGLWLSNKQDIVFNSSGAYFYSDSLVYAGQLSDKSGLLQGISAFSISSDDKEVLVTRPMVNVNTWNPIYGKTYTALSGFKYNNKQTLSFPLIDSKISYGRSLFHSAANRHVAIVQTDTREAYSSDAHYYIVVR